jgi:sporulation protein YlmC with PRC-barrel domain
MKTGQSIKVLAELRDLEVFDQAGELCGIADDVEFEGEPGGELRLKALLVGPGAYRGRLPRWAAAMTHRVAGDRITRVPWAAVEHVTSRITLNRTAEGLGLNALERSLRPWLAKLPFA